MSDIAIKIQNLGKRYQIRHDTQEKYQTIREAVSRKFSSLIHPLKKEHSSREDFWALKDVSFDIKRGECVGIVGRNGAGKSTLLRILSRITEPTTGRIALHGRVASLLEVGTGFHQELTGRENIYLNGTILGMRKKEIDLKFDEIVAFAEIERFLDTPVKHYSSGMYVRLAFAVAAHLETEILIVDEVLAVGDAQFQKKCLGKMGDVARKEGKTVLFVSHNMGVVKKLCSKGILLERGLKTMEGEINSVSDRYMDCVLTQKVFIPFQIKELDILVTKIILNEEFDGVVLPGRPLRIDIELEAQRDITKLGIQIMISHDDTDGVVFSTNTKTKKNIDVMIKKGKNKMACLIHHFDLCSGKYRLGFAVDMPFIRLYYAEFTLFSFDVAEVFLEHASLPTLPPYGHVYLDHDWIIENQN